MFLSANMWLTSHKISPSLADRSKKIAKIPQKQGSHESYQVRQNLAARGGVVLLSLTPFSFPKG